MSMQKPSSYRSRVLMVSLNNHLKIRCQHCGKHSAPIVVSTSHAPSHRYKICGKGFWMLYLVTSHIKKADTGFELKRHACSRPISRFIMMTDSSTTRNVSAHPHFVLSLDARGRSHSLYGTGSPITSVRLIKRKRTIRSDTICKRGVKRSQGGQKMKLHSCHRVHRCVSQRRDRFMQSSHSDVYLFTCKMLSLCYIPRLNSTPVLFVFFLGGSWSDSSSSMLPFPSPTPCARFLDGLPYC